MKIHKASLAITEPSIPTVGDLEENDWYADKQSVDEYYANKRNTLFIWKNGVQHHFSDCNTVIATMALNRNDETTFLENIPSAYNRKNLEVYKVDIKFKTIAMIKINR